MNPRHATALVLMGFGAFLNLVGAIFAGIGLTKLAESEDRIGTEVSAWFAAGGGLGLGGGVLALLVGIRIYRRSDHRLPVVRDARGRVVGHRFPILSPIIVFLFLLVTVLLVWSIAEYGVDLTNPEAIEVYAGWAVFALLFLAGAVAAGFRRWRGVRPGSKGD
jgi:hypothetical protein